MAEGSTNLPVTPETTKSNEGNSRRNPMGKANSSNSGEKVLPHYLRASTGSCHDFCKYGRMHAFEAKERCSVPKTIIKPVADEQSPTVTVILPERKKTSVVKPKPSSILKTCSPDVPEIIKRKVSTKSAYGENLNASSDGKISVKSEFQSRMKTMSATKLRPSLNSKARLSESPKFKRQEVSSQKTSSKSEDTIVREVSSVFQKADVSSKKASSKSKDTNASAKHATSLKLESLVDKPLPSPDHSGGLSRRRNSDILLKNKTGPSKVAVKKALASPRLSSPSPRLSLAFSRASLSPKPSITRVASLNSRKHKSLKVVSPLKNQGKIRKAETEQSKNEIEQANNDLVHEKTLYVIKMETENKSFESAQNESYAIESSPPPSSSLLKSLPSSPSSSLHNAEDEEHSEYTETEAENASLSEYEYDKSMSMAGEDLGGEDQGRHRKDGMVCLQDKDSQATKLHFRRGKIIDILSENNGPRRLKFRRGRVLGEGRDLKVDGRRSFKKRVDGEMDDSKPNSEKVVLRHQDVQGKKYSEILFNNVIEQTASKLVESRKSKVKALVGAFETVISLQETNPSANIVT